MEIAITLCVYVCMYTHTYTHLHLDRRRKRKPEHCQQVQVRWASSEKFDTQGTRTHINNNKVLCRQQHRAQSQTSTGRLKPTSFKVSLRTRAFNENTAKTERNNNNKT